MGRTWVLGLVTLTIALGMIGLLAFTSESVHRVVEPGRPLDLPAPAPTAPPADSLFERDGLVLTY